jgi:hypothetical protein
METDLSLWRSWRKHQLADGVENDLKLGVVFVFERGKLRASSVFERSISRKRTSVRMMAMLTCTARELRSALESIATPCSVKA